MKYLLSILLALITSAGYVHFFAPQSGSAAAPSETAYERVLRTGVLRCGYAIATPWMMVDPATNALSGVSYDMTRAVADKLGLKVEWVEETGWGVAEQGIMAGRYDMLCGNVCVDPKRTQAAWYSRPFVHIPLFAIARSDDTRFDQNLAAANSPDIHIGVKNGHVFEFTTNENFPKAHKVYLNDISDDTEFLLMLKGKKIDIAYTGQSTLDLYTKANGNVAKTVGPAVRFCNGGFMMPRGDVELKHSVDAAIAELNAAGTIQRILNAYMPADVKYARVPAHDYQ